MELQRRHLKVSGIVQGVGFRPFVASLAASLSLKGWVYNAGSHVEIEIEGIPRELDAFETSLINNAPPLSHIKNVSSNIAEFHGYNHFTIKESSAFEAGGIFIPADVSVCSGCLGELIDKNDRRYLYPFINCTNCGPRFTIIKDVPYDRSNTTMRKFEMCNACAYEYTDSCDRRYHAQPVSCYACGPKLTLVDKHGTQISTANPVAAVQQLLGEGNIVAIKGLGGYHLSCNALNVDAVRRLRLRKARDDKPFALMMKDYATADRYCSANEVEQRLLDSPAKPIVLLNRKISDSSSPIPYEVASGNPCIGVMLPYTPLHYLLFYSYIDNEYNASHDFVPEVLVMTSGNMTNEPISFKDAEALENLSSIADYFLMHDRDIYTRVDDSVTRVFRNSEFIIRRSRGYVPKPVTCNIFNTPDDNKRQSNSSQSSDRMSSYGYNESLKSLTIPSVLACGGELKSTFCINKDEDFYLSHHIGDLENAETLDSFEEGVEHFKKLFHFKPDAVAYDLHPSYLSTSYALSLDINKKFAVQHHHAHIASCMAENNITGEVIGIAFDGTGYGEDGNIWGGEFFTGSYQSFRRQAHLEYAKMPGSEAAIKQPWRMAISYIYKVYGADFMGLKILKDIDNFKINSIIQMMDKNLNSPLTSSMGRFFDAVSSLLNIRHEIRYEGQAAIELEHAACHEECGSYTFEFKDIAEGFIVCIDNIIRGIINDICNEVPLNKISAKFHETVADVVLHACIRINSNTGLEDVVLSGGVFQNMLLLEKSVSKLEKAGFKVYIHSKVPSNDGGVALGQAVIAAARLMRDKGDGSPCRKNATAEPSPLSRNYKK